MCDENDWKPNEIVSMVASYEDNITLVTVYMSELLNVNHIL